MKPSSSIGDILSRVKKPGEAEATALSKCFPYNKGKTTSTPKPFDPSLELVVEQNHKKKKSGMKKSKVEVVMLKDFHGYVPKGESRKRLRRKGRISQLQISRSMSASHVQSCIKQAFKHLEVQAFSVLETDPSGHFLSHSASQEIDGQRAITRRGALYVCEEIKQQNTKVSYIVLSVQIGALSPMA